MHPRLSSIARRLPHVHLVRLLATVVVLGSMTFPIVAGSARGVEGLVILPTEVRLEGRSARQRLIVHHAAEAEIGRAHV